MNCKIVLTQLDDYLDAELKPFQHDKLEAHLATCDHCYLLWQQELVFRQLLKDHPVAAPAADLENRVFAKLPDSRSDKKVFVAGFSAAIAASIVLIFTAAIFITSPLQQDQVQSIALTLHQSEKVNMVFDVPEQVAEATFSMQVPGHIEIAGQKGLHKIEWKTALKKGKNLLSLPIVANAAESAELIAKIRYGNQEKIFKLKLNVDIGTQGYLNVMKAEAV